MRFLREVFWVLLFWAIGGGFFGAAPLLLSTAVWPVTPFSAFVSANLGSLILSFIVSMRSDA